jgi:hypothetical protein
MKYICDTIETSNHTSTRIQQLFIKYPNIDQTALGFQAGWENEPLWK